MSDTSSQLPAKLFDFQINGFGGVDFQTEKLTAQDLERAAAALRRHGVSSIFATLVTAPIETLCRRFQALENARASSRELVAMIPGYHLEGPWLSPQPGFRGGHTPEPMHAPSLAEFERLQEAAGGRIRLVTLAPEWPGSSEFIAELTRRGIHVSLGHTDASEAQIDAAIRAGARFVTHLGNGSPTWMHRHDNAVQRLLARDELTACLIADGIHLPRFVLKNFFRAKPGGRVLFTTDAVAAAGAPPGRYTIGHLVVDVGEDRVIRPEDGNGFLGGAGTPDDGVRLVSESLGIGHAEAVRLWSEAPRRAFGLE